MPPVYVSLFLFSALQDDVDFMSEDDVAVQNVFTPNAEGQLSEF